MAKPKDITGQRFGRLVAVERTDRKNGTAYYWKCLCDCGNYTEVPINSLTSGNIISCGCAKVPPPINTTHGLTRQGNREKLYGIWSAMKNRCCNEKDRNYSRYGGRGITVCDEWLHNYIAFRSWCYENGYKQGLELDREDNNRGYSPDNCRFVTHRENLLNTHRARKYRVAQ